MTREFILALSCQVEEGRPIGYSDIPGPVISDSLCILRSWRYV